MTEKFRRTASPVASQEAETDLQRGNAAEMPAMPSAVRAGIARDALGIEVPPLPGERFILVEGQDDLGNDRILMALAQRPDVLSVLRSQLHRLLA